MVKDIDQEQVLFKKMNIATVPKRALYFAFFLSGMSGLVYQIVWVRMLTRYLGSTTSATATVLCVFMGGLALGAFLGGKVVDRIRAHLFGYVILELGIALIALLSSFTVIVVLGGMYVDFYHYFGDSYFFLTAARVIFSMLCLLPPTVLMGATFPLLVAFVTHQSIYFQKGLGSLYSVNTFGAVLGVITAGFFLIGKIGESSSLLTAALLNFIAAAVAYRLHVQWKTLEARSQDTPRAIQTATLPDAYPKRIRIWSKITIFISGFTALAYEILWARFLALPLRTSIYAFSFMLGLFLIGIALGSWLSTKSAVCRDRPVATFAILEIIIGFMAASGMFVYSVSGKITNGFVTDFYLGVLTCAVMVLPVAVAFGYQFPVAVRCCISDTTAPGKETGWAYSANTIGSILGSVAAGFVLIPFIGTAKTMVLLGFLNILLGVVLLWISPAEERGKQPYVAMLLTTVFAVMVVMTGNPYKTVMRERVSFFFGSAAEIFAFFEGIAGTTVPAGLRQDKFNRHLYINGTGMTGLASETKLMAHLPMALVSDPKRMLVICFGMGTTVRSASRFPAGQIHIDAVDIVPRVFDCFGYFHDDAEKIKKLPYVDLYAEDGRNFLLVRQKPYDVITIDPAPPIYSAGTVNLYTREFLELCKARVTENGSVCLWLPPGPLSELFMIMKTFVNVFPGASLWGGLDFPGFYLIGGHRSFGQTDDSIGRLVKQLSAIPDLWEWDERYKDADALRRLYLLGPDELVDLLKEFPQVTDDRPYTEFPLWRGVLTRKVPWVHARIIRRYAETLK